MNDPSKQGHGTVGACDMSRRGWLQWSAALSAGAVLSACGGGSDSESESGTSSNTGEKPGTEPAAPVVEASQDTLPEPQVLTSVNGVLEVHIYAKYAPFSMELPLPEAKIAQWAQYPAPAEVRPLELRTLNGQYMAPTLVLHPGDILKMWVHNELPPAAGGSPWELLNHQNNTNMHFHGLHVDPREIRPGVFGDFVVDQPSAGIAPGQTRYHEVQLPANHSCGIFWYHPHLHGATNAQVSSGMFGAILVKDAQDPFSGSVPMRERVVFAHKLAVSETGRIDTLEDTLKNPPRAFMFNGKYQPTIVMRPGEVQQWHFLNPSSFYPVYPVLDGHDLNVYARDGIHYGGRYRVLNRAAVSEPVDMPSWPGQRIYPGGRLSVVVQASMTPGVYGLRSAKCPSWHHPANQEDFEELVARVVVEGEPMVQTLPDPKLLRRSSDFTPITDAELASHGGIQRSVHVAILSKNSAELATRPTAESWDHPANGGFVFVVGSDGTMQGFAPFHSEVTTTQTVKFNAVEEWTIWNHNAYPHPFHIHVNNCYVVRVNEQPVEPFWADTLPVPPMENGATQKGSITFRMRFEDFYGKFVWHCHALNHEDLGMMQAVEIVV